MNLFNIFPFTLLRKQALQYAFKNQNIKKWQSYCEVAFIDSNGIKYYKYIDETQIPVLRYEAIHQHIMAFQSNISKNDLKDWISTIEALLEKGNKSIVDIALLVGTLKERQNAIFEPDTLFNIISIMYIREDEDATKINPTIHKEKIQQFEKDSQSDLYVFFYQSGLFTYFPFMKNLQDDLPKYMEISSKQIQAFRTMLKKIK